MKAVRITLGILSIFAMVACTEGTNPLSPDQTAPRRESGLWTVGVGATEPVAPAAAADTTSRSGLWTVGVGD